MSEIPLTFDERGLITVHAAIAVPVHQVYGNVLFYIDTGSTHVVLSYATCEKLKIDQSKFPERKAGLGFGGRFHTRCAEEALLFFRDREGKPVSEIPVREIRLILDLPRPVGIKGRQARTDKTTIQLLKSSPSVIGTSFFKENNAVLHLNWEKRCGYLRIP
ncbi:MAG: hypothetical protein AB1665_05430 [Candidatus Thermoplasmatota archaeon]